MTEFVTSSRGDRVAYDVRGSGPGLIFVAGAGPSRESDPLTSATAELVAQRGITTIVYDRLGRGESGAEGNIGLDRELAAIAALIEIAGGSAVLCGHSSGGSIALLAAVEGLAVDGLALWETPVSPEREAVEWAAEFERRLDAGDLEGALEYYMKDMPPEWLEGARRSPAYPQMVAQVVTSRADAQSLSWAASGSHAELFGGIRVPVLVMYGEQTYAEMVDAADSLVGAIPDARQKRMPGAGHMWEAEPMAQELAEFVLSVRRT
ncbi:alpha/beta fold hydrolase [Salinibacterium hongtaonis]|uniref:Alpha/beta hydrolase n=1 Tax=Homoserinimonas hongtaonis TaxID=2079791 RepID=A0A2U1T2J4_9MICO|nr:alpha/beta hydrolase [Salinibacterium hongtaonis]AWB88234.1 alpha/beta hydrolase [Salinibacterium hongtaonis]PWB97983.1 alpha/beta hydrolase [Salinibacterium hongtaonis]